VLQTLLPELVAELRFRKSMRWNETNVTFSRPIRWLVALLGGEIVPVEYAGVASGRTSTGSRPAGSPALPIAQAEDYLDTMAEHEIGVDPEVRRQAIVDQTTALAEGVGGEIPDDPELLAEVTHLVEQPTAFLGSFDERYLALPSEVLVAVMKKHQRTFPVADDAGDLLPHFIAVRNGGEEHMDIVRLGNEEVIRARFADAEFFYEADTRQPLEDFLPRLDTLTFQEQLGSMLDKTGRLEELTPEIAEMLGLEAAAVVIATQAAHLCKADLATQMVVEFTSLQGVMGREYALKSGHAPEVARAIFEHYLPRSAGDAHPETDSGLAVGLADRLDSLAGLFAVGLAPTGSADPYGLRRGALGVVQNLIAAQRPFSISEGLAAAARLLTVEVSAEALEEAQAFVVGRLRVLLRDQGYPYDIVEAVLNARGDDPYRAQMAVEQLSEWVEREDWPVVLDNYARCVRITRGFEETFALDPDRFVQPAEEALYEAYLEANALVTPESTVEAFLTAFLPMVEVIDHFFARESGVLVMAEDEALRENRLALLQHVAALADGIVDLSQLEGF
jgi:glycyl-tRNA synthetase